MKSFRGQFNLKMNLFVKFFQYYLISLCKYDILFLGKKDGYIETEKTMV